MIEPPRLLKKRILKKTIAYLLIFTVSGLGISFFTKYELEDLFYLVSKAEKMEFAEISQRYEQDLWGEPNRAEADEIAAQLVEHEDGLYFKDIDYEDDSRAGWQPMGHILRLRDMVRYYGKDLIGANEEIRAIVLGALNYWLKNDFKCPNWWYNEIGTPTNLAEIGIMLNPFLSFTQILKMKQIIERGSLVPFSNAKRWTGANMLDGVAITVKYAFFTNKAYLLKKAVAYAEKEIFISEGDAEGIKPDYTFYQHGAQQAIASYGIVFVSNLAKLASLLSGTSFQFAEEKLGLLIDFMLYGQRYACRGMRSNYLTNGRSYSRMNGNNANGITTALGQLLTLEDTPKKPQLLEFYNSFSDLNYSLYDNKYFPYAHTLFDIAPNYYMAVKGAYSGFTNSERINFENVLARNMGYGGLTTYQYTGYEYDNISAVWDFAMLPGTTAYYETDEILATYLEKKGSSNYRSTTVHSDGAADGEVGGLYVDIENEEGLFSRQAYITYKGLMIGLGTSISCSNSENTRPIFTTINQVYANNTEYNGTSIEGNRVINDSTAVYNGAFAYYNLGGGDMYAKVEQVTGDLNRNNRAASGAFTEDIFTLYYAHGIRPENRAFAYAVFANSEATAPNKSENLPILRITNTHAIQAVEFVDGTAVIIFHQAGIFATLGGEITSASNHCLIII